jgi:hypothetical protein
MKTFMLAMIATALLSARVAAQEKSEASKPEITPAKPLVVSGRVSNDGKTLMTDIDSEWTIDNAEALKGHEGRLVKVKCYVDTAKNRIQILSVKKDDAQSNYTAARYADSAFRR